MNTLSSAVAVFLLIRQHFAPLPDLNEISALQDISSRIRLQAAVLLSVLHVSVLPVKFAQ
jgi:hypothetical protein